MGKAESRAPWGRVAGHSSLIGECAFNRTMLPQGIKSRAKKGDFEPLQCVCICACTSSHTPVNMHTDIYAHHMHVRIKEKELAQNKTLYYLKYTTNVSTKIKYLHLPKSMNQKNGHFILSDGEDQRLP